MLAKRFLVAVACAACSSIPAFATLQTYTNQSTFNAATGTDAFSNIAFTAGSLGTSTTAGGIVFSTSGAGLTGSSSPSGWPTGATDPALVSSPSNGGNTLTITLPSAVDAVEFYIGPQDYTAFEIAVTDSNGAHFLSDGFAQPLVTTPVFFGVTTDGSFTSFTITTFANPDMTTLDDFAFAQSGGDMSQTPEAATFLLVGTGLFCMGYFRRRGSRMKTSKPPATSPALAQANA